MRIVLDTNVLLASVFWNGTPSGIVQRAIDKKIDLLISEPILNELRKVLQDPEEKFQLTEQESDDVIAAILVFARIIQLKTQIMITRDPNDNHVIACGIDGQADYIISRDKDLLALISYKEIKIIQPEEFLVVSNRNIKE